MPADQNGHNLNPEQLAAVTHPGGPCVVLAGAGSGKTRVIVHRVAWLIEQGARPEDILLLTFTNKAAGEMMERIRALLGAASFERRASSFVLGGTFHSIANRLLRQYADLAGFTPSFSILDEEDAQALFKASYKALGFEPKGGRLPAPAVTRHTWSYARNACIPFEDALGRFHPKFEPVAFDMRRAIDEYSRRKQAANAMDFDDLLVNFRGLLERHPDVKDLLAARFRHVLVDEYQDTNAVQAAIVRLLAGPDGNAFVVGDDAQSIYSFRAADVRNILDFRKIYPDAATYRLVTNYRSTPQILDLANDVISRNADQFPKDLRSVMGPAEKPAVVPAVSATREAETVADRIEALRAQGTPDREIAVLFRAAFHSQALEFELMKRGIDYDYRGGVRFFERAHVKDVLSFLRLMHNVADEAAWMRVLGLQTGIGETTAARIFASVRSAGSIAAICGSGLDERVGAKASRGWEDLRSILEGMRAAEERPSELIRAVLDSSYATYVEAEYPDAADRLEDLEQLATFSASYQTLGELLADTALNDAVHRSPAADAAERGKRLVLSTIHQAKGLEWDAVFLIHLTDSGFPNRKALMEDGGLEEERRLFYVAVTRARRSLFLSYHAGMMDGGFDGPSMFLTEADHSCLDRRLMSESAWGGLVLRPTASRPDPSSQGGFYEEPSVDAGGDGEMGRVAERMKAVNKDWKKKSFLSDI